MTPIDALLEFAIPEPNSGCWIWQGGLDSKRYGNFGRGRHRMKAHRLAWSAANGRPIPEGMHVLHSCDVPLCVNPDHLSLGTHQDNMDDKTRKGRNYGKLTAEDIATIWRMRSEGARNKQIAAAVNAPRRTIEDVIYRKNHRHLAPPTTPETDR